MNRKRKKFECGFLGILACIVYEFSCTMSMKCEEWQSKWLRMNRIQREY